MIFKTKRFMYDVFEKDIIGQVGCNAIIGARNVGKTVLMTQLAHENSNSLYKDVSLLDVSFEFREFYEYCIDNSIVNVFLDEVCKLDEDLIGDFLTYTRLYAGVLCIVITGSVASSVSELNSLIGRGGDYELPPIMYIERLLWSKGYNRISQELIKKESTYESFIQYLKNQNSDKVKNHEGYIINVVNDSLESYLRNTSIGDSEVDITEEEAVDAVKYISLCQFVYKKDNGSYVDVPIIRKDKIEYMCNVLTGCHLAKSTYIYRGSELNLETVMLDDLNVNACVFEYPWLASICISNKLRDLEEMLGIWVENAILLRELYIYSFVDKVRFEGNEMNTVYGVGDLSVKGFYGLEVKNRTSKNISNSYLRNEREFAESLGLNKIEFTSLNDEKGFLRVDKVIASLELEYMNLLLNGDVRCDKTIGELVNKYFG